MAPRAARDRGLYTKYGDREKRGFQGKQMEGMTVSEKVCKAIIHLDDNIRLISGYKSPGEGTYELYSLGGPV